MNVDIKNFFYGFFYRLDPRIAELNDLTGIGKNDVVMLPVEVRFFIMSLVLAELVLSNQSTLQKQVDSIV